MTRESELSIEKTSEAFEIIMTGSASSNDIADFLSELQNNGITEDHVIGAVNVMKKKNDRSRYSLQFNGYVWYRW